MSPCSAPLSTRFGEILAATADVLGFQSVALRRR